MTRKQLFYNQAIRITEEEKNTMQFQYSNNMLDKNLNCVIEEFQYISDEDFKNFINDYNTYCYVVMHGGRVSYYCIEWII